MWLWSIFCLRRFLPQSCWLVLPKHRVFTLFKGAFVFARGLSLYAMFDGRRALLWRFGYSICGLFWLWIYIAGFLFRRFADIFCVVRTLFRLMRPLYDPFVAL